MTSEQPFRPSVISPEHPLHPALTAAVELARSAGRLLLAHLERSARGLNYKRSASDIVTEADVLSEELILSGLKARGLEYSVVAEESAAEAIDLQQEAVWLVDPLDGTTNFASGLPFFSVSIALWLEGKPAVGVVHDVVRNQTYWALAGCGAWLDDGRRLHVSQQATLSRSVIGTGFPFDRLSNRDNNLAEFAYLAPRLRGIRRHGSAALDQALVAAGRLDAFWEAKLMPWDWGAGVLLVKEAGGRVTDYKGAEWSGRARGLVVSNGLIHDELLEAIHTARREAGLDEGHVAV
ncbi:MAG: inositol monophosphatase [Caldilineae bacterium]|nr:MAG: inositol monophosphatase [Caldilineae bacterium]